MPHVTCISLEGRSGAGYWYDSCISPRGAADTGRLPFPERAARARRTEPSRCTEQFFFRLVDGSTRTCHIGWYSFARRRASRRRALSRRRRLQQSRRENRWARRARPVSRPAVPERAARRPGRPARRRRPAPMPSSAPAAASVPAPVPVSARAPAPARHRELDSGSAFNGVESGQQVNREADRGRVVRRRRTQFWRRRPRRSGDERFTSALAAFWRSFCSGLAATGGGAAEAAGLPDRRCGGGRFTDAVRQEREGDGGDARRPLDRLRARDAGERDRRRTAYLRRPGTRAHKVTVLGRHQGRSRPASPAGRCPSRSSRTARSGASTSGRPPRDAAARLIGRDELAVIQTMLAIVDAQRDYAALDPMKTGAAAYARRLLSSPGEKDGLYWETPAGQPQSPLGPAVAKAQAGSSTRRRPLRLQLPPALRPGLACAAAPATTSSTAA